MKSQIIQMVAFFIVLLFSNCSNDKKEAELKNKISQLESELDECKNGEDKLYNNLKSSFDKKDFNQTYSNYTVLINKYPNSKYLLKAKEMFEVANIEIKNSQILEAKNKAKLEEEKRSSLKKLKLEYDDVNGVSWYKQKYFTHYTNDNKTSIYLGKEKGAQPFLRLQMSYTGESWIFFEEAYLSYDGNTKQIYFDDYKEKKSDNDGGEVWEWIDVQINDSDVEWLRNFAESKNAKMRLSGKYTKTRNLTPQERQGIIDVINGYEYFKENI